jgi:hypothetical protein
LRYLDADDKHASRVDQVKLPLLAWANVNGIYTPACDCRIRSPIRYIRDAYVAAVSRFPLLTRYPFDDVVSSALSASALPSRRSLRQLTVANPPVPATSCGGIRPPPAKPSAGVTRSSYVTVALCSNDQIDCSPNKLAGRPGDLRHNISHRARSFGAKAISGAQRQRVRRVSRQPDRRRRAPNARCTGGVSRPSAGACREAKPIEQLVVLDAVHGDAIDRAVTGFWRTATGGTRLTIDDGTRKRTLDVHVADTSDTIA